MKNNFKRCLALLLALMSIVGSFAIPVSAAEACDHDWEEYKTVAPTCTTVGYTTYVCKLCSESKTENLVAKLNHTWVKMDTMKDSNCTKITFGVLAGRSPLSPIISAISSMSSAL